jgi:site-specific DNA recombinase
MKAVAAYVRVSTQRQAQSQSIEQQLERLRAHLRGQGEELTSEAIFRDDGYSGATLNRPGLDRLRDAVRAGEVERVLVTDPDRLARNYVQLMVLLEELERAGCEVAFLDRPMGRDPQDQLLLQIRGAVAEYERTLITERMRRGRQAKLRAGCLLPWTRPPYGYRLDPDRPRDPAGVTVEAAEAAVVRELFAGYVEDHASLFSLAKHLHALGIPSPTGRPRWSPTTLRGLLTNPTYTGQVYAGRWRARAPRTRRSATHPIGRPSDSPVPVPPAEWLPVAVIPALVSEERFAQAQAKLARNRAFARRHNTAHAYLLRALVSCGVCRSGCPCAARSTPATPTTPAAAKVIRCTAVATSRARRATPPRRSSTISSGGTCASCSPTPSRSPRPWPARTAAAGYRRSCRLDVSS